MSKQIMSRRWNGRFIRERFIKQAIKLLIRKAPAQSEIVRSDPALILAELHIQYPVELISNSPTTALGFQNLTCSHAFATVGEVMRRKTATHLLQLV